MTLSPAIVVVVVVGVAFVAGVAGFVPRSLSLNVSGGRAPARVSLESRNFSSSALHATIRTPSASDRGVTARARVTGAVTFARPSPDAGDPDAPLRLIAAQPGRDIYSHLDGYIYRNDTACVPRDVCRWLGLGGVAAYQIGWPDTNACARLWPDWLGFLCADPETWHVDPRCPRASQLSHWVACPHIDATCPRPQTFTVPSADHAVLSMLRPLEPPRTWTAAEVTHIQIDLYNMPRLPGPTDVTVLAVHGIDIRGVYAHATDPNITMDYSAGVPLWSEGDDRCVCVPYAGGGPSTTDLSLALTSLNTSRHVAQRDWRPVGINITWHTDACPCTCPIQVPATTTTPPASTTTATTAEPPSTTAPVPTIPPDTVCTVSAVPGIVRVFGVYYWYNSDQFNGHPLPEFLVSALQGIAAVDDHMVNCALSRGNPFSMQDCSIWFPYTWGIDSSHFPVFTAGTSRTFTTKTKFCFNVTDKTAVLPCDADHPTDGWSRVYFVGTHTPVSVPATNDVDRRMWEFTQDNPSYLAAIRGPVNVNMSRMHWNTGDLYPLQLPFSQYMSDSVWASWQPRSAVLVTIDGALSPSWRPSDGMDIAWRLPHMSMSVNPTVAGFLANHGNEMMRNVAMWAVSSNCVTHASLISAGSTGTESLLHELLSGDLGPTCTAQPNGCERITVAV